MMHPRNLSIHDFTYQLPEDRIARYPLPRRDDSKLLIYKRGRLTEDRYKQLEQHIPPASLLVFNNTKVVEARLLFQKATGGVIELFCLEPAGDSDITTAMLQTEKVQWKCLVGGAKKWKEEPLVKTITLGQRVLTLNARKLEKIQDHFIIEFTWNDPSLSFADVLHAAGDIPLPPYLNRKPDAADKERYQTVYARHDGSVAAPTAGLHFTSQLLEALQNRKVSTSFVTLHVSAGTFKPVKADTMDEHEMHAEFIEVSTALIQNLIRHLPETIIAVGTTSLRTLESLYWMGVKIKECENRKQPLETVRVQEIEIRQWDAYELPQDVSAEEALTAVLQWMQRNTTTTLIARTQIIIAPGYSLRIANALITNFHQPQSTLLLLVAAITGDDWKTIYDYALANDFRFLSYGDGSLLWGDRR
jgi:S-adenosylmethionine:tRNA ribosyltransferase-isomerase